MKSCEKFVSKDSDYYFYTASQTAQNLLDVYKRQIQLNATLTNPSLAKNT